ncbi:MAG: hypothetical protein EU541_03600 [Promethearchaeota archaeon]|nr:MAG: hypothetical protein EU541_03600 [Candidatus Lokiarchaeota archaeon]
MKYFKAIFLFLLYEICIIIIFYALIMFFPKILDFNLSPFIPSDYIVYEQMFLCNFLIPFSGIIGYLLGGYVLAPTFLYFHKKIFGSKLTYGIQKKPEVKDISILSKSFFPVMLAINIASTIIISSEGIINDLILSPALNGFKSTTSGLALRKALTLLLLFPTAFAISMFVFSSVWFLKNSGIVYSNKKKVENLSEPWVIRSVGGWYHTILKGYGGVGVIITFTSFLFSSIASIIGSFGDITLWLTVILWFTGIFLLILATIPSLILNELLRKKSASYVMRYAHKMKINQFVNMDFSLGEDIKFKNVKEEILEKTQKPNGKDGLISNNEEKEKSDDIQSQNR